MTKLEEGLRELATAENIAGDTPPDADRCPHCGASLPGHTVSGDPGTPPTRAN